MTFSRTEHLIIVVGLKLSIVLGFVASLGLVGALFVVQPMGRELMTAFGCTLTMSVVAAIYLALCLAIVGAVRRGEGA